MSKSWEQILGGYATDTLSQEEKHQLLEAALHDQRLFDALADEEALKSLLADPEARQRILASLQASGNPQAVALSHRPWFRRPTSLAWAGSIAAMGLALIFGWQMETDWGLVVQQEQQVEYSASEDKDKGTFLSQASGVGEVNTEASDSQKAFQGVPERVQSLSAPASSPEPAVVQHVLEDDQGVASSVESPRLREEGLQQLSRAPSFAEQVNKQDGRSSLSARELFYANKGRRADAAREKIDGMRMQQFLEGASPRKERVTREEASDLMGTQKFVIDSVLEAGRGIRYRFVQRSLNGKDAVIDLMTFSGKLSELTLEIESNVSGYLYVLTSFGTGKWQWVRPGFLNVPRSSDGGINVMPYQSVNFALSQFTNTLGKPVVSSITVLLSSTPLMDLGQSLGGNNDMPEVQIEREKGEVFVVETTAEPGNPFKMEIVLK